MFEIKKTETTRNDWTINILGRDTPVDVVKSWAMIWIMAALLFFGWEIGSSQQSDFIKTTAYLCQGRVVDSDGNLMSCTPVIKNKMINWDCNSTKAPPKVDIQTLVNVSG